MLIYEEFFCLFLSHDCLQQIRMTLIIADTKINPNSNYNNSSVKNPVESRSSPVKVKISKLHPLFLSGIFLLT